MFAPKPEDTIPYKVKLLPGTKTSSAARIVEHISRLENIESATWVPVNKVGETINIDFYFYVRGIAVQDPLEIAMAIREMEMKDLFNDFK